MHYVSQELTCGRLGSKDTTPQPKVELCRAEFQHRSSSSALFQIVQEARLDMGRRTNVVFLPKPRLRIFRPLCKPRSSSDSFPSSGATTRKSRHPHDSFRNDVPQACGSIGFVLCRGHDVLSSPQPTCKSDIKHQFQSQCPLASFKLVSSVVVVGLFSLCSSFVSCWSWLLLAMILLSLSCSFVQFCI